MIRLTLLLCGMLAWAATVTAGPSPECLTNKYNRYAQAQETWQRALTQLVVEVAPRYEEVSQVYLADQLRAVEQAKLTVQFLAYQDPGRLRVHLPLNNWFSLEEADRQRIAAESKRYAQLLELRTVSRNGPPHPDGDGLREVMRSKIMTLSRYKAILEEFSQSVQAAEEFQCQ